jgi:hypothetical protein
VLVWWEKWIMPFLGEVFAVQVDERAVNTVRHDTSVLHSIYADLVNFAKYCCSFGLIYSSGTGA